MIFFPTLPGTTTFGSQLKKKQKRYFPRMYSDESFTALFSSFFPRGLASNCAYPRWALSATVDNFFLQINSKSHHGGIRPPGPTRFIVYGIAYSTVTTGVTGMLWQALGTTTAASSTINNLRMLRVVVIDGKVPRNIDYRPA